MPSSDLARVLRPGQIGSLAVPHRIVMGAMHLGLERRDDRGAALAEFYVERVRGGAGLMVTGGVAVSRVGAGGTAYAVLGDTEDRDRLGRVATEVHRAGGLIALQLFHAGRYAFRETYGLDPVAPSPVYSRFSRCEPVPLSEEGIEETLEDFRVGASHAAQLGFDAVEIMASEGYLVDQFLSPLTNQRDDGWGGDAGRRIRFGVEVLRRVRAGVGAEVPVIVRLTGADLMEGGTPPEDVVAFAQALAAAGADALNVGVGWHEAPVPTVQAIVPPGTWVAQAAAVKQAVGELPVMASNRVNRLELAEAVLAATPVDFVSMARPFLADPRLVARGRRGQPVNVCIGCNQACIDRSLVEEEVSCLVNPRAGHEREIDPLPEPDGGSTGAAAGRSSLVAGPGGPLGDAGPSPTSRAVRGSRRLRAAVVGGGPAGLQAAQRLAGLGHQVDLYEGSDGLGGQFRLAQRVPGKEDYGATIDYFAAELARFGVRVHLGRPITSTDAELLGSYDGVIVASGARPRQLDLPGISMPHVISYTEAFTDEALGSSVVIIGGGGIAVDVAHAASRPARRGTPAEQFRQAWKVPGSVDGDGFDDAGAGPPPGTRAGQVTASPPGKDRQARSVTILQRGSRLGPHLGRSTRWVALGELSHQGVEVISGVQYRSIEPEGVQIVGPDGSARLVVAETVVVAAGQEQDDTVAATVRHAGVWHQTVGGARLVTGLDAVRAFAEGLAAADALCRLALGTWRA